MNHTPEPWEVGDFEFGDFKIYDKNCIHIATVCGDETTYDEDVANASRIVSCVNACAGIENPEDLRKQRDELMEVLKDITKSIEGDYILDDVWVDNPSTLIMEIYDSAKSKISKCCGDV